MSMLNFATVYYSNVATPWHGMSVHNSCLRDVGLLWNVDVSLSRDVGVSACFGMSVCQPVFVCLCVSLSRDVGMSVCLGMSVWQSVSGYWCVSVSRDVGVLIPKTIFESAIAVTEYEIVLSIFALFIYLKRPITYININAIYFL